MINKEQFWLDFKNFIQTILVENSYNNWVTPVYPTRMTEDSITLSVPNNFIKNIWEEKLAFYIIEFGEKNLRRTLMPTFIVDGTVDLGIDEPGKVEPLPPVVTPTSGQSNLNPKYTFDRFVVGDDNMMAHGAALAVCDNPGQTYNPFLIYGGVGLGKTHLMQAIGNEIKRKNPNARIKYATTETFMNDFINSISNNTTDKFKKMYREDIDVLLMDDIQFFENRGEGKTQEEFFHTFNDLFNAGKQIILTSDRLPNAIKSLEERLISRFRWGLSVDITPPDLETRIAILRKKALNDNLDINSETLTYIANNINTNIRELEGALIRVIAFAAISGEEITTHLASRALNALIGPDVEKALTIDDIINTVAKYYQIQPNEIKGTKRVKHIVVPRQVAMYLSRELTDISFPKIGDQFGNRNHTTIMHAYDKIVELLKTDQTIKEDINQLTKKLKR